MRIDHLRLQNFKGFESREVTFHPEVNLVVGVNGTGKTSLLEGLAVAAGSWFLGIEGHSTRPIAEHEIRLKAIEHGSGTGNGIPSFTWEPQEPCAVEARGEVSGKALTWRRSRTAGGRTTSKEAWEIRALARDARTKALAGYDVLPLISYYGTGRLWDTPRDSARVMSETDLSRKGERSRLDGYRNSIDPSLSVADLARWFARQSWITFQKSQEPEAFPVVRKALVRCVDGAENLYFDANYGEIIVEMKGHGPKPFNNLSDGQKTMLAMVGDMAYKAAILNPQLAGDALAETPGVVLVDELDLHLHPKWQRTLLEDLRQTFPKIQLIATSHSPFLIQSLRSGDELIVLDGQPVAQLADMPIEKIARGIQGIANPETSARYDEMKGVAKSYLETLEEAKLAPAEKLGDYMERLGRSIRPYADNPAFQAFLEMQRAAKLGS